jgi:hypothetical protein
VEAQGKITPAELVPRLLAALVPLSAAPALGPSSSRWKPAGHHRT